MTKTFINEPVEVTAMTFTKQFEPIPRRIEFHGRTLTFLGSGMRYLVKKGENMVRLCDMTDGEASYRLRRDGLDGTWRLVTITR